MWLRLLLLFGFISNSMGSSSVILPVCWGFGDREENITADFIRSRDDLFKSKWDHTSGWNYTYSPIMCGPLGSFIEEKEFTVDDTGSLILPCRGDNCCGKFNPTKYGMDHREVDANMKFCMDNVNNKLGAHICLEKINTGQGEGETFSQPNEPLLGQKVCLIISAVFLVITCIMYSTKKQSKNNADDYVPYLVSQSISLAIAFVCLARIQFSPTIRACWECMLTGYCLQYFFLAAFFWMNSSSILIYLTMSRRRPQSSSSTIRSDLKWRRFKIFACYAWGMPLLITAFTFLLQTTSIIEDHGMRPDLGDPSCFLRGTIRRIYYDGPIAVIMVVNVILFALTARILVIHRIKKIDKSRKTMSRLNEDLWVFNRYLKLFIVTGLSWVGEVLESAFMDDSPLWSFWKVIDFFNCLQGVFIFFFFVCQNEKLLKKLFCIPINLRLRACSLSDGIFCRCFAVRKSTDTQSTTPTTTQVEL